MSGDGSHLPRLADGDLAAPCTPQPLRGSVGVWGVHGCVGGEGLPLFFAASVLAGGHWARTYGAECSASLLVAASFAALVGFSCGMPVASWRAGCCFHDFSENYENKSPLSCIGKFPNKKCRFLLLRKLCNPWNTNHLLYHFSIFSPLCVHHLYFQHFLLQIAFEIEEIL